MTKIYVVVQDYKGNLRALASFWDEGHADKYAENEMQMDCDLASFSVLEIELPEYRTCWKCGRQDSKQWWSFEAASTIQGSVPQTCFICDQCGEDFGFFELSKNP